MCPAKGSQFRRGEFPPHFGRGTGGVRIGSLPLAYFGKIPVGEQGGFENPVADLCRDFFRRAVALEFSFFEAAYADRT
jgi:hypothetical protein